MLNCKHASHLLSQSMEKPLALRQRLALRLHLLLCDACTHFYRQLTLLRQAIRQAGGRIEHDETLKLPGAARERIAAAMRHQEQSGSEAPER